MAVQCRSEHGAFDVVAGGFDADGRRCAMTAESDRPVPLTAEDIDYKAMALDAGQLGTLVGDRGECVFTWSTREGYPVGVVVAYVYRDGTFWTTCAGHKKRLRALRARPKAAVVISKDGHTATFKGDCVIHGRDDDDWDQLTRVVLPSPGWRRPGLRRGFRSRPAAVPRRPPPGHHPNPGQPGRQLQFRQVQRSRPGGHHQQPVT